MEDAPEGKFTVDFTRKQNFPFEIKSETSYDSWLARNTKDGEKTAGKAGSLVLGLKKSNCIAWVDIPHRDYEDHVIEAKIRIDSLGGYAATGVMFRIADQDSYYLALVSSKGYFRLDVVKENAPKTLIAWTDFFGFDGTNINLKIITYGTYLIFLVNEKWVGEVADDTIMAGRPGFALASYLEDDVNADASGMPDKERTDEYICKAWLDYFSVDTRVRTIEDQYKKWTDDSNINAEGRLRLAETFAVMGKYLKALDQIQRAWKRRDEVILSSSVSGTKV
ncbi:MAG: hypothetical protein LBI12_03530, partial [Treponema sp.]|nr:hypothetical protein [Treponema sp.]